MPLTPLHRALGVLEGNLTFDLVRRACEEAVAETDELEWKSEYPLVATSGDRREHEQVEFAKDLAAMANGRGGLIVYGVDETREANVSHASAVASVGEVDERRRRTLNQVAASSIYPPIVGVTITTHADSGGDTVLAVQVPASEDAPHLIRGKNSPLFGAPWRNGPDTAWMVERQLEDAYRTRIDQRRRRDADLDGLLADATATYARDGEGWLFIVAKPTRPRPARLRMPMSTARYVLEKTWERSTSTPGVKTPAWMLAGVDIRSGLRRFRQVTPYDQPSGQPRGVAELHHDGSVVFAMTRGEGFGYHAGLPWRGAALATVDVDYACEAFFHLLALTREQLAMSCDYDLRLSVTPTSTGFRPVGRGRETFEPVPAQSHMPNFLTVSATVPLEMGLDALADSMVDVARDGLDQVDARPTIKANTLVLAVDLDD